MADGFFAETSVGACDDDGLACAVCVGVGRMDEKLTVRHAGPVVDHSDGQFSAVRMFQVAAKVDDRKGTVYASKWR